MKDYTKVTKKIDCNHRIRFDNTSLKSATADVGDTIEVLFKVTRKKD